MSQHRVYISFSPVHSLHIVQPLFNSLLALRHDVYMNMEEDIDEIDLRQIKAREHFVIVLSPEVIQTAASDTRLEDEIKTAINSQRNMIVLMTKDFNLASELKQASGIITELANLPRLRISTGHMEQVAEHLDANFLKEKSSSVSIPAPSADMAIVEERVDMARSYAQQATIRLNTEKRFLGAVSKIRQGLYEEALNDLDLVISENRHNENAYLQRGRVLRRMGRTTAALRDYEQATFLSPKMVAAHIGRGELLLETERYQQAASAFEDALNAQANSAPALAGLALTYHATGQPDRAREIWQELLQRDENYGDADWTGQVFGWTDTLQRRAASLLDTMK